MSSFLKRTPLHDLHVALGARMAPFAGYDMPIQYREGVLAEHRWTRESAGLFDVSHMGPFFLRPEGGEADLAALAEIVETLTSADVAGLAPGRIRYGVLLNEAGGMLDDLMIARAPAEAAELGLYLVVNGAVKEDDLLLFADAAKGRAVVERADDGGLIALQGPKAVEVLETLLPGAGELGFMSLSAFAFEGQRLLVARSGYTGEDGFEVLVPAAQARRFAQALLDDPRVRPAGLGARDSLRLEAGLPLYGHDADATTSPIEAGLAFAVSKKRLRTGGVRGAERLSRELAGELRRLRVGLHIHSGAPAREGAEILGSDGEVVGVVTSGGFSPTLSRPIAMGYVPPALAETGAQLWVRVRGREHRAETAAMPFVPHRYVRKP